MSAAPAPHLWDFLEKQGTLWGREIRAAVPFVQAALRRKCSVKKQAGFVGKCYTVKQNAGSKTIVPETAGHGPAGPPAMQGRNRSPKAGGRCLQSRRNFGGVLL